MSLRDEIEGLQLKGNVGKLVDWLAANDVGLDAIGSAKLYQGFHKDADDEAQVVDMVSLELSPAWLDGPKWPLIDRPAPVKVAALPGKKPVKPVLDAVFHFSSILCLVESTAQKSYFISYHVSLWFEYDPY